MRDKETGRSKGFAFLKYEDQRSTILAVDNFNGAKVTCTNGCTAGMMENIDLCKSSGRAQRSPRSSIAVNGSGPWLRTRNESLY